MIYTSYLQGDSLQAIKAKLEAAGAVTVRGNTTWSTQSVLRILQNEKYCGDVLLQKTYTEDVLSGVHRKNTGQLPQYYIENNHEGIVSKQMFFDVQAEIARHNSKGTANQRKRRKGRYNSKYALSERLVCGQCGSYYKRVTWDIHGRKQIVWRCISRLEYGKQSCPHSPSISEEKLQAAILRAIRTKAAECADDAAAQLNATLQAVRNGEAENAPLQAKLEQAQRELDHLIDLSLDCDERTPFLDAKLKQTSEKIKSLKSQIEHDNAMSKKSARAKFLLTAQDMKIHEYSDVLVARVIEQVTVLSADEIEIRFIDGSCIKTALL